MSYPPDPHVRCKNTCPHGDCGECLPLKTEPCAYPPPGWQCSRGQYHCGPCAARPRGGTCCGAGG